METNGIVQSVSGIVIAIAADGTERLLSVGDSVAANETIITRDGIIVIAFNDGSTMDLASNSSIVLSDELLDQQVPEQAAQTRSDAEQEIAALQQALSNNPDFDPADLPATAAGATAAGTTDNNGHTITSIDYLSPEAVVESGFDTVGISGEFAEGDEELPPLIEGDPIASVSVKIEIDPSGTAPTDGVPNGEFPIVVNGSGASVLEGTSEGTKPVVFIIRLDQAFELDVQVTYQLTPLSADNPGDWFDGDPIQTITIPAGETTFEVTVQVVEDHFVEANETFSITLIDASNATINLDANSATITIYDDDTAPVANDDAYTTAEDTALIISIPGVLINDTDEDGDPLNVISNTSPTNGTVSLNPDGSFTYTPNADYNGSDSFTYTISDGFNEPSTATVTINITPDIPTINVSGSTVEEGSLAKFTLTLSETHETDLTVNLSMTDGSADASDYNKIQFFDINGNPIGNSVVIQAGQTSLDVYVSTFDNDPPFLEPLENYTVTAALVASNTASAEGGITDATVDLIPTASPDSGVVDEDDLEASEDPQVFTTTTSGTVIGNGGDQPLSYSLNSTTGSNSYGTMSMDSQGNWVYTLNGATQDHSLQGEDSVTETFSYTATDSNGSTATATITITIIDDIPTAISDPTTQNLDENTDTVAADLSSLIAEEGADGATITHIDGDAIVEDVLDSGIMTISGANGNLVIDIDAGTYHYEANDNTAGGDSFTFTVTDADSDTDTVTVAYSVGDASQPTAEDISRVVDEDDLPDGSSPNNSALTTSGVLADLANFSNDIPGSITFSSGTIVIDGDAGNTLVVDSPLGLFTIDGTGAWSYTLDTSTTTHSVTDVTGVGDQVSEVFDFTVVDSDGGIGVPGSLTIDINDDGPAFILLNDGLDVDDIVTISSLNPDADTVYTEQFADWFFGADGFGAINLSALPSNVEVDSTTADKIVLNLKEGSTVVGILTLNADGTDSLEVMHRDGEIIFIPIAATSATAGGPEGSLLVDLDTSASFNILVSGSDGDEVPDEFSSPDHDLVNTSNNGWAVKGDHGQTNELGESILFSFVDDDDDTTGFAIGDFKFTTEGYTQGITIATITVKVYLNADLSNYDEITIDVTSGQIIAISEQDWSANAGTADYILGDGLYAVEIISAEAEGSFRLNGIEVGDNSETVPDDLAFENIGIEIVDADGDTDTQTFSVFIDGSAGDELTVEAIVGTSGDDILLGSAEDDLLFGGAGSDELTGDAGADIFAYSAGDGGATLAAADLITDFTDTSDLIGLENLVLGNADGEVAFVAANTLGLGGSATDTAMIINQGAGFSEVLAIIQNTLAIDMTNADTTIL